MKNDRMKSVCGKSLIANKGRGLIKQMDSRYEPKKFNNNMRVVIAKYELWYCAYSNILSKFQSLP